MLSYWYGPDTECRTNFIPLLTMYTDTSWYVLSFYNQATAICAWLLGPSGCSSSLTLFSWFCFQKCLTDVWLWDIPDDGRKLQKPQRFKIATWNEEMGGPGKLADVREWQKERGREKKRIERQQHRPSQPSLPPVLSPVFALSEEEFLRIGSDQHVNRYVHLSPAPIFLLNLFLLFGILNSFFTQNTFSHWIHKLVCPNLH